MIIRVGYFFENLLHPLFSFILTVIFLGAILIAIDYLLHALSSFSIDAIQRSKRKST